MRKQPSQLTRLIWDFYRENQTELQKLKLLGKCKVFRRWGVLNIRCWNGEIAETVISLRSLIEEPIAKLRIAREIQISVDNTQIALFEIGKSQGIKNQSSRNCEKMKDEA
ncbi:MULTISPECIES: hypothetical protein [Spirulina sp. CCY15215]|uniref:hypothetical protein n=1 Tax=Spirulina sp. CCY15215 TaxID=2767591 RepID=UPI001951549D|nr:hypothetical protein [Spirulina major]